MGTFTSTFDYSTREAVLSGIIRKVLGPRVSFSWLESSGKAFWGGIVWTGLNAAYDLNSR